MAQKIHSFQISYMFYGVSVSHSSGLCPSCVIYETPLCPWRHSVACLFYHFLWSLLRLCLDTCSCALNTFAKYFLWIKQSWSFEKLTNLQTPCIHCVSSKYILCNSDKFMFPSSMKFMWNMWVKKQWMLVRSAMQRKLFSLQYICMNSIRWNNKEKLKDFILSLNIKCTKGFFQIANQIPRSYFLKYRK